MKLLVFGLVLVLACTIQAADWYCYFCDENSDTGGGPACFDPWSGYFGEPVKCASNTAHYADYTCYKELTKDERSFRGCGCPMTGNGDCIAAPWDDDTWDNANRCKKDDADNEYCTCGWDLCNSALSTKSSSFIALGLVGLMVAYFNKQ